MINVLCYGDSNTYGYNPLDGGRFSSEERWTGRLQSMLGKNYKIIEAGQNGRTAIADDPYDSFANGEKYFDLALRSSYPVDLVVIMLGSNDLKIEFNMQAQDIANGVAKIVEKAINMTKEKNQDNKPSKVLLVSPIHIGENVEGSIFSDSFGGNIARQKSLEFSKYYKKVASDYDVYFMDAGYYVKACHEDELHLDGEGHRILAYAFKDKIKEIMSEAV